MSAFFLETFRDLVEALTDEIQRPTKDGLRALLTISSGVIGVFVFLVLIHVVPLSVDLWWAVPVGVAAFIGGIICGILCLGLALIPIDMAISGYQHLYDAYKRRKRQTRPSA